jgi:hypothetical protein
VATVDIPGAFMQVDMDELVPMRLERKMVDLLLHVHPEYGRHMTIINGRRLLYVQLTKALYGMIRAALLFWRKLTSKLRDWGFVLNPRAPYCWLRMDPCQAASEPGTSTYGTSGSGVKQAR